MRIRRRSRRDDGYVVVIAALSITALFIFVALVVDLGDGQQKNRQAQNAVDAAALAAVASYDGTTGTRQNALDEALRYLDINDFSVPQSVSATTDATVVNCDDGEVCTVHVTFNGSAAQPCIEIAIIDFEQENNFATVIGDEELLISAAANGCKQPGVTSTPPPGHAGFAGGDSCGSDSGKDRSMKINMDDSIIEGDLHSNHDVGAHASDQTGTFVGSATYVGQYHDVAAHFTNPWTDTNTTVGAAGSNGGYWPEPWRSLEWDAYDPNGAAGNRFLSLPAGVRYNRVGNDTTYNGSINAGLYVTDKKFVLGSVTVNPVTIAGVTYTGATFVTSSTGEIDVTGNNGFFEPFEASDGSVSEPAVFASFYDKDTSHKERCASNSIRMSGNCHRIDGVIFAKYSGVEWSGNGNGNYNAGETTGSCGSLTSPRNLRGGVVAWAVKFESGDDNRIRAASSGGPVTTTDDEIFLDS